MSRTRLRVEIIAVFALVEAALWTEGSARAVMTWMAAIWVVGSVWLERPSLEEIGLGRAGLVRSSWVALAAAFLAGAIVLAGKLAGSSSYLFRASVPAHLAAYLPWALAQQFAAQSFFFRRLAALWNARTAVVVSAALFSTAHLPNPVLVPATLAGGLLFAELFRRYRNLYPLAIAHAMLALAIAVAVPDALHRHMHVGIGYVRYRARATSVGSHSSREIRPPLARGWE